MNTILQKRIEEAGREHYAKSYFPFADPYEESKEFENDCYCFKEGATFALQNQWISVDEALPEYEEDVFVRFISRFPNITDEFEVGYCTRWRTLDKSVKTDSKGFSIIGDMEITHWCPIPQLKGCEG